METAIKIEHLNKSFGAKQILHDVSFETYSGEIFGFLGPNGAGKTTTIKLIVGLLQIEDGSISICGHDVQTEFAPAMSQIGGIVENPECYKYMSGMQNLRQYARMRKGVTQKDIEEAVELVGLSNWIHEKVSKYSLGMRQRLGVAQALLHHPKVLILDEPTNGLDPAGIKHLRDILKEIAHKQEVSVLVSSHLMSEMELMCDRIGVITNGKMLTVKSMSQVLNELNPSQVTYSYHIPEAEHAMELLAQTFPEAELSLVNNESFTAVLNKENCETVISQMNRFLIEQNLNLITVSRKENGSLEDAFMELTAAGGEQIA